MRNETYVTLLHYEFGFFPNIKDDLHDFIDFFLCLVAWVREIRPLEEIPVLTALPLAWTIGLQDVDHQAFPPKAPRALLYFHTWVGKPSNILHGADSWSIRNAQVS